MEIKRVFKKTEPGLNEAGEVVKEAELVLKSGKTITPGKYKSIIELPRDQWEANGLGKDDDPVLDHIKVRRLSKRQNFTQKFIDRAIREGFMSMIRGKIVLHDVDGDLTFKIVRSPGHFCCHDNAPLGGEKEARAYVAANFKGVESPDKNNPSGYRKDNFHACELVGEAND